MKHWREKQFLLPARYGESPLAVFPVPPTAGRAQRTSLTPAPPRRGPEDGRPRPAPPGAGPARALRPQAGGQAGLPSPPHLPSASYTPPPGTGQGPGQSGGPLAATRVSPRRPPEPVQGNPALSRAAPSPLPSLRSPGQLGTPLPIPPSHALSSSTLRSRPPPPSAPTGDPPPRPPSPRPRSPPLHAPAPPRPHRGPATHASGSASPPRPPPKHHHHRPGPPPPPRARWGSLPTRRPPRSLPHSQGPGLPVVFHNGGRAPLSAAPAGAAPEGAGGGGLRRAGRRREGEGEGPGSPRSVSPPRQVPTPQPERERGKKHHKMAAATRHSGSRALRSRAPPGPLPLGPDSPSPVPAAAPRSALGIVGTDGEKAAGRPAGAHRPSGCCSPTDSSPRRRPAGSDAGEKLQPPACLAAPGQRARRGWGGEPGRRGLAGSSPGRFARLRRRLPPAPGPSGAGPGPGARGPVPSRGCRRPSAFRSSRGKPVANHGSPGVSVGG